MLGCIGKNFSELFPDDIFFFYLVHFLHGLVDVDINEAFSVFFDLEKHDARANVIDNSAETRVKRLLETDTVYLIGDIVGRDEMDLTVIQHKRSGRKKKNPLFPALIREISTQIFVSPVLLQALSDLFIIQCVMEQGQGGERLVHYVLHRKSCLEQEFFIDIEYLPGFLIEQQGTKIDLLKYLFKEIPVILSFFG